ncbi:MAG: YafY family transcriptional regulator [Chloroflexi bacterium]|nr:MAG: YafY family transcriptional regulator [Chloroflexota bacterium]
MYHPTTRVLAVLALLQAHGRMSGPELAQRLEVNIRTLRRYIIMLQDLGIPIEAERGRHGAYVLSAGFKLPPMMFTNEEALALTIGLLSARRLNLADTDRAVESALAKLERVMPLELKSRVRALAETITLDRNPAPSTPPSEMVLSTLSSAAQLQQRVHIQYHPNQGEDSERDFDPYGLTYYQQRWYVVGYCHLRQDLRSFRLDRITNINTLEAHFKRPAGFDPLAHLMQAITTMPRSFAFELLLKTDIDTAQKEVFDVLGILEATQDGIIMRGSVEDLDWLARQISIFSFDFVIRAPAELKAELKKHSAKLADLSKA